MSEMRSQLEQAHKAAAEPSGRLAMMLAKSGFRPETIGVLRDCVAGYERAAQLSKVALATAEALMEQRLRARPPSPGETETKKSETEFDFAAEMPESVKRRGRR